mmetsp:Transcript_4227/g.4906  ORF Transcript_4227/g.4906 Transcript_4227/m.4906 type:complete len:405 (-) Transcript_4227:91-1305(-)|eukprot:CAMPEP_0194140994 /NCGR_PEP_ID=MMETSP0152-20130528/10485_1 /TAXON_ID=1049557 /ORGANISM="Thalassiothrix antarctica, Strain L6-D1" /LENGTH=404 /DNA_ID=CAMNT_0038839473 /DNA_START=454 /DNA_END=1668 /DNA_ORIENTATION=+
MESNNSSVIIPPEEFAEDLELRLGRANGNIFHRKPGVEGVHDGQIMVRLKKKRYIIIDYSIIPTPSDLQAAAISPHVNCPDGAGKNKCVSSTCNKVGVPVSLYDSEPIETASLYIRSGLCFTCQRNLNEKRRTQRKRKSDLAPPIAEGSKKIKINGTEVIQLSSGAIIINGQPPGIKRYRGENLLQDIALDLQTSLQNATTEIQCLFAQDQSTTESAVAYAAAAAAAGNPDLAAVEAVATNAAVDAASTELLPKAGESSSSPPLQPEQHSSVPFTDGTNNLYEKAFTALTKSVYLLSHWKAAWDSANQSLTMTNTGNDTTLAGTSPPEVSGAALSMEGHDQAIIPLLLAAEEQKENTVKKEFGESPGTMPLSVTTGGTEELKSDRLSSTETGPNASGVIESFEV